MSIHVNPEKNNFDISTNQAGSSSESHKLLKEQKKTEMSQTKADLKGVKTKLKGLDSEIDNLQQKIKWYENLSPDEKADVKETNLEPGTQDNLTVAKNYLESLKEKHLELRTNKKDYKDIIKSNTEKISIGGIFSKMLSKFTNLSTSKSEAAVASYKSEMLEAKRSKMLNELKANGESIQIIIEQRLARGEQICDEHGVRVNKKMYDEAVEIIESPHFVKSAHSSPQSEAQLERALDTVQLCINNRNLPDLSNLTEEGVKKFIELSEINEEIKKNDALPGQNQDMHKLIELRLKAVDLERELKDPQYLLPPKGPQSSAKVEDTSKTQEHLHGDKYDPDKY